MHAIIANNCVRKWRWTICFASSYFYVHAVIGARKKTRARHWQTTKSEREKIPLDIKSVSALIQQHFLILVGDTEFMHLSNDISARTLINTKPERFRSYFPAFVARRYSIIIFCDFGVEHAQAWTTTKLENKFGAKCCLSACENCRKRETRIDTRETKKSHFLCVCTFSVVERKANVRFTHFKWADDLLFWPLRSRLWRAYNITCWIIIISI